MPNYKEMYYALLNAMTDAVEKLQVAQRLGEEMYVESSEDEAGDNRST